jgi:hypothetical protein
MRICWVTLVFASILRKWGCLPSLSELNFYKGIYTDINATANFLQSQAKRSRNTFAADATAASRSEYRTGGPMLTPGFNKDLFHNYVLGFEGLVIWELGLHNTTKDNPWIIDDPRTAKQLSNGFHTMQARNLIYSKYKNDPDNPNMQVTGVGITRFAPWTKNSPQRAGIDPVEQFLGGYSVDIFREGNRLRYEINNTASINSYFYHVFDLFGDGDNVNIDSSLPIPMKNLYLKIIFYEDIDFNRF